MMDLEGSEGNEGAADADGNPAAAVATSTFTPKQEEIVRKVSLQEFGKEFGISPHPIRDLAKKASNNRTSTTASGVFTTQAVAAAAVRLGSKKARSNLSNEPVCITLSSDEDGEGDDEDTNDAIPHNEQEVNVDLEELGAGGKLKHSREYCLSIFFFFNQFSHL